MFWLIKAFKNYIIRSTFKKRPRPRISVTSTVGQIFAEVQIDQEIKQLNLEVPNQENVEPSTAQEKRGN